MEKGLLKTLRDIYLLYTNLYINYHTVMALYLFMVRYNFFFLNSFLDYDKNTCHEIYS